MDLQKILNIFEEHGFNENNCSFFRQEDITDIAKEIKAAINYTHCSTQLPNLEDVKNQLDRQFFKDYETFSNSKKFYYKRGWNMCFNWIDKIVRGKAIV